VIDAKSRLLFAIFAVAALAGLVSLGLWQLERRAWKQDLISRLTVGLSQPPVDYTPPRPNEDAKSREFKLVRVHGVMHNSKSEKMLVPTPETLRGQIRDGFGYLIYTPLAFDGGIVFVNRGFVPASLADALIKNMGDLEQTVTGIIRKPEKPGSFTPRPDPEKRLFYAADIPAMAASAGIAANKLIDSEYIEADTTPNEGGWPRSRDAHILLAAIPNRHLEYAVTWFGLAAALTVALGFYILRK
jgi:surfeit locus 1 family protein